MRICFIASLYPPYAKGGAERVVEEELRSLKALGHDVCLVTAEPVREDGSVGPRITVEGGVRVWRFHPVNLFFYGDIGRRGFSSRALFHLWDLRNPHAAAMLRRILEKERPDVVHTHQLKGLGFGIPGLIRRLRLRHIHTVHDVSLAEPSGLILKGEEWKERGPLRRAYRALMRRRMGSPDVVISPSRFLLRWYAERGFFPRSAPALLPNPAPEARPLPHRPSPETRFLFIGQVERHKGILLLIDAFKRLLQVRPRSLLYVVGAGSALEEARKLADGDRRIAFYGRKNPAAFAAMFSETDYAVVPSLCYENAPTVVVESFAYGVPVIAADIGGAAELVRDGENGFVVPPADVAALAEAMRRAADGKAERAARSAAASRTAALLASSRHAERLIGIYTGRDPGLPKEEPVVPMRYVPAASSARSPKGR